MFIYRLIDKLVGNLLLLDEKEEISLITSISNNDLGKYLAWEYINK